MFCVELLCRLLLLSEIWKTENRELQPLDDVHRQRLDSNWQKLLTLIDVTGGLVGEMFTRGCISRRQKLVIERQPAFDSTRKLLDIVSRKSLASFDIFVKCLEETNQRPVAILLSSNAGNIVRLILSLRCMNHKADGYQRHNRMTC